MKRGWLGLLLLLCCASGPRQPTCNSHCWMWLWGAPDDSSLPAGWTCESFIDAEDRAVRALAKSSDKRLKSTCSAVYGWALYVAKAPEWTDSLGRQVAGQTDCEHHAIQVSNEKPLDGAIAHEMAHAGQNCKPYLPVDFGADADHANWYRAGIFSLLNDWYAESP